METDQDNGTNISNTGAEGKATKRTQKQAKDTHETEMESSLTHAKEGDDTPDNILSADAASNKDTNTGTEEDTSERTQKQGERLESSMTPAKQEGDTVAHGEPNTITPNQGADTATENTFAEKTSKQAGVAKGESTEIPPNQGDDTPDNILSADAASNKDTEQGAEEETSDQTLKQGETLDSSVTPAKQEGDTVADGEATKITPHQGKDTHETEKESSATPAKEDGDTDAKGEPTILKPNRGDGTPDNKLTADVASNEGEVTTENEMGSSLANAKEDVVAKGEPTELPPNQGGGADAEENSAEITPKEYIVPNEETTDLTLNQGKSGKRTSKQEENITENETEFSVTQAKDGGDTDANRKPTEITPNQGADTGADEDTTDRTQTQGAETDANDKCADRTQKESRNEKGGEPTEPTSSKGVNSSKCLGAIPQSENENHDSNQLIQSVIDTNEGLINEIILLKQEIKDIARDRDGKQTGMAELVQKDIRNQTMISELRDELETLKIKSKEEIKRKNAKINEIEKENNNFRKKDAANEKNKKEIKQQEDQIKKQREEIRKMNVTINQLGAQRQKYENEITSLNKNIAKLNAQIRDIENKHKTEVSYLNRDINNERQNLFSLSSQYNDLIKRLDTSQREVRSLSEEKKELLLRLSKVAGANLTYNNPNIADLSDEKRPTKLAEEFSELYDNEWTDVFEELDFKTENGKTNFMLDILMKTNEICNDLSNGHTRRIKDAFCRLTTTSLNMERSGVEKKEVLVTDFQKEEKVASRDKDVVKEENTGKNETHDDDEQLDPRGEADFKHQFKHESKEAAEAQHDGTDKGAEEMIVAKAEQLMDESTGGQLNADNKESRAKNDKNNEEHDTTDSTTMTESRGTNGTSKKNDLKQAAEAQHYGTGKGAEEMIVGKAEPSKDMVKEGNTGKNKTHDDDEQRDTKSTVDFKNKFEHETREILEQDTTESVTVTKPREKNVKSNENDLKQTADAQHDGTDKGDEEMIVGNAETSKNESAAGHLNTLNAVKKENNAGKDNNNEDQKNTTNKEENYDSNQQKTGEDLSNKSMENEENDRIPKTAPETQHGGTDKETEERIEGKPSQPKHDAANENANELQSNRTSEHEHDNTAKQPEENKDENQVETPGSPIKDKTDSDTLEAPEATHSSMDDVTETPTEISIESDFELLRKEQKKTIMDAKIFFENELAKEVETTVAAVIGKEFKTDTENKYLMDYIMKCVNICWSMFRHNPPVFIEFPAIKETVPFDTNKYKPYTSSGKFIDYIVWPALHLHEGGPLLCKGVAQGLGDKNTK